MRNCAKRWENAGAEHVVEHYSLSDQADKLAARCRTPPDERRDQAELNRGFQSRFQNATSKQIPIDLLAFIALLPSFLKRSCYRLFFGYKIGKRVRIGLSIIDAQGMPDRR